MKPIRDAKTSQLPNALAKRLDDLLNPDQKNKTTGFAVLMFEFEDAARPHESD